MIEQLGAHPEGHPGLDSSRERPRSVRTGARRPGGRLCNVDVVNRFEAKTRSGRQARLAEHLTWIDFIVLDEPGCMHGGSLDFERGNKTLVHFPGWRIAGRRRAQIFVCQSCAM